MTLRYGKALRGYGRSPDRARVYGTNGPVGYTSKPLVDGPGVIVGRKGAYRGIHYAAGDFWVIDTAFYLEAKIELDMLWAYYALQLADINGLDSGSAIPSTTREAFAGLPVLLPSPPEQRAIAEVLSALDDKIAANTALARVATQLASSEFNRVVRGVDPGPTFDQIATVSGGGTPSTTNPDFWDGSVSWATPTDMTALAGPYLSATSRSISKAGLTACSSKLFEPGAVLMTSRATIGAIAVNTVPTAVNQGFIVVEPHDDRLRWWLFHEMESRVEEFISWANGATFLELSRGNFKRLPVRVPADDVVDSFAARASALHDRARAALDENRTLAATRDALLPQLMSGKLRVRDAKVIATDAGA